MKPTLLPNQWSLLAGRGLAQVAVIALGAVLLTAPAQAAFHLWNIREIYSDSTGTRQFVEFSTAFSSQQFVAGQSITIFNVGATLSHSFTIPSNLPSDSANHAFLLGTASLQASGGPAPDFIIPNNFLFTGGGSINFFGANSGPYSALPTDGVLSRTWTGGNAVNTPQNFAGQIGVVPEPAVVAMFGVGGMGLCLLRRRLV